MGAWVNTGIGIESEGAHAMVVFNGNVLIGMGDGSLWRSIGGSAPFIQVAATPEDANGVLDLKVINSKLYGLFNIGDESGPPGPRVAIFEWTGAAWVLRAISPLQSGAYSGLGYGVLFPSFEGAIWCAIGWTVHRWDGVSGALASHDLSFDASHIGYGIVGTDGVMYLGSISNGRLSRWSDNDGDILTNQLHSGNNSVMPFEMDGVIYAAAGFNFATLFRWDGGPDWVTVSSLPGFGSGDPQSMIEHEGRIYIGWGSLSGERAGEVHSIGPGETIFTREAPKLSGYTKVAALAVLNGHVFGAIEGEPSVDGNFYVRFARLRVLPEASSLLPDSTASISHARILRGERSPEQAYNFHEMMKERIQ